MNYLPAHQYVKTPQNKIIYNAALFGIMMKVETTTTTTAFSVAEQAAKKYISHCVEARNEINLNLAQTMSLSTWQSFLFKNLPESILTSSLFSKLCGYDCNSKFRSVLAKTFNSGFHVNEITFDEAKNVADNYLILINEIKNKVDKNPDLGIKEESFKNLSISKAMAMAIRDSIADEDASCKKIILGCYNDKVKLEDNLPYGLIVVNIAQEAKTAIIDIVLTHPYTQYHHDNSMQILIPHTLENGFSKFHISGVGKHLTFSAVLHTVRNLGINNFATSVVNSRLERSLKTYGFEHSGHLTN